MSNLKNAWEQRASEKGTSFEGVLYRGFGPDLNHYIHQWHVWVVVNRLLPCLPAGAMILDLGCGYGRLRKNISAVRPDLHITGMDFSETYCRLHKKEFNAATVCGDINRVPFGKSVFDGVVGITSLMYLEVEFPMEIIGREVLSMIKPGGYGLFVDPGLEFMRLARRLKPSSGKTPTKGQGFSLLDYQTLGEYGNCRKIQSGAVPMFTLILPLLMACRPFPALVQFFLTIAKSFDYRNTPFQKFSLQRWTLLQKIC